MKRVAPATAAYRAAFQRLTSDGWCLRNYGGSWRYFARPVESAPLVQAPNSHPDAPATLRLHECCRVHSNGTVEQLPPELLA